MKKIKKMKLLSKKVYAEVYLFFYRIKDFYKRFKMAWKLTENVTVLHNGTTNEDEVWVSLPKQSKYDAVRAFVRLL